MSNPNFVSDLVAMAKAFEELPQVREELEAAKHDVSTGLDRIQMLEQRLLDLKAELDRAHEATRKAEVERDHAEQMFLETDDRLNAFQRLLRSFQSDANSLVKASEPEPTEQVSLPQAEASPVAEPTQERHDMFPEPEYYQSAAHADLTSGQSDAGEQPAMATDGGSDIAHTLSAETQSDANTTKTSGNEGVSVQPDPTSSSAETSSENVSPVSTSESTPLPEPGGFSMQPIQREPEASEVAPADPTASSTAGDGPSPVTATATPSAEAQADASTSEQPMATQSAVDDVGYHNEPKIAVADGMQDWDAWDAWAERMNKRYPAHLGGWPARPTQAAQ